MNSPAIRVEGLCKRFRDREVLKGVSFEVQAGQTFAFLGRNAAGKTTTIRMLLGLLAPDSGSVSILGINPQTNPLAVRRRVGYLAEDQRMFGWMTVAEIVRFIAPFYDAWDEMLAIRYLDQFELPRRTKIKHLSKGQNVRLGLVLALSHRPEVVILDDPVLGLDPIMRKEFNRDLIAHLQGEGRTVLYSSHLLYEVEPVADAVGILSRGQIVRQGTTEELREQVKRLLVPAAALGRLPGLKLLDVATDGERTALTVDDAPSAIAALHQIGIEPEIVDLNLDEIFEAFVIGRAEIPAGRAAVSVSARELERLP
jgi:ABC-2 type transport system ATP-binding protein